MYDYTNMRFGSYRAVELLTSEGGFGGVYLGKHPILNDKPQVAIKILQDHRLDEKNKKRFLQEALLLNRLKHPHILPLIDANLTESGVPYLITEYAPGGSLRAHLQKQNHGPLSQEEAMTILVQIGLALSYAHQRNIVHCDLKPENILFTTKRDVLLADFGIAVVLEEGITKASTGEPIGTPRYMAPEQFHHERAQDAPGFRHGEECALPL